MRLFRAMESSTSALTAERLRMDLIANNLANMNTTAPAGQDPYRRRYAVQAERRPEFQDMLDAELGKAQPLDAGEGVRILSIQDDQAEFKVKYDPSHPHADANGLVRLPNVDMLTEITDMMMSQRIYEANVSAFNAAKNMAWKAMEIGK